MKTVLLVLVALAALTLWPTQAFACDCVDWTRESGRFSVTERTSSFCVFVKNCTDQPVLHVAVRSDPKPVLHPLFDTFACVCGCTCFGELTFEAGWFDIAPYQELHLHLIRMWLCKEAATRWTNGAQEVCYSDYVPPVYSDCGRGNDPYELIINNSPLCP